MKGFIEKGHSCDAKDFVVVLTFGSCFSADYSVLHLYFVALVELFGTSV